MHNHLYSFLLLLCLTTATSKQQCERKCGDIDIPYPFGINDPNCAMIEASPDFFLNCNVTTNSTPKLFLGNTMEVTQISLDAATISVRIDNSYKCYDQSGPIPSLSFDQNIELGKHFTFSTEENKLIGLGCDTMAFMGDADGKFASGCVSLCDQDVEFAKEGACSGLGCCQTSVPKGVKTLNITLLSEDDHAGILEFSPCDFALLVDLRTFNVSAMRLGFSPRDSEVEKASVLLDWVVGNETCEEVKGNVERGYACGDNAECSYSDNGIGYRCHCAKGFRGNPYRNSLGEKGCEDIDECKEPHIYKCEGYCKNTFGDYECKCPLGKRGDGKVNCHGFGLVTITSATGASASVFIMSLLIFYDCKRRKREQIFRENGGLVLKHQRVRIFSTKELSKATNNYDQTHLLGTGGFASVYMGIITDQDTQKTETIAVKKPKDHDNKIEIDKQQFHEEIAIVSQVNHKNVVKLLGLCLETKIPLLVYEYISNGTLYKHIHSKKSSILRSWKTRLRIAKETALALDYLHSLAHPPIIHRDVKSTNILVDENYTAKVSDFGASVLIPHGQTGIATTVQGTLGYLDPEYLNTGTLTTKSDVYSFGVVLVELITGEKPISSGRTGPKSNIIQYFVSKVRENRGDYVETIVDHEMIREEDHETVQIEEVAELAARCLEMSGVMRPSMKDVAEELSRLSKLNGNDKEEETKRLIQEMRNSKRNSNYRNNHSNASIELVEYSTYDVTGYELGGSLNTDHLI